MKHFFTLFMMMLFLANAIGQNVGINNSDPQTTLDVNGKLRIRKTYWTINSNFPGGFPSNAGYIVIDGDPGSNFTFYFPLAPIGTFLIIENATLYDGTGNGFLIPKGKSKIFLKGDIQWIEANNSESQLEKITENGNTGWRLLGRDPNNYGDIGDGAVDLSYADGPSITRGATGWYSLATGIYTTASGSYSTAMGDGSIATGETSLAANSSWAAGLRSASFNQAQAHGENSFATGNGYVGDTGTNAAGIAGGGAFGVNAAALGVGTHAVAFSSTAVGRYNEGGFNTANRTSWVDTDPLFMIGNGTDDNARSNALLVQKNGKMSIGPAAPAPSSILDIQSTTAGFLPPRMTLAQRNAIATPAEGLMISCTDCSTKGLHQYINGAWQAMMSSNTGNYGTVVNPVTGKIWLDRNLGATQVATSSTDAASYGDLYQWGRAADGHQIRTSATQGTQATTFLADEGNNLWDGKFIIGFSDWLTPAATDLWSGTAAENNPCPSGYRVPTNAEWNQERRTWTSNNAAGAFASPLKLPLAGFRSGSNGSLVNVGTYGDYRSSTVSGADTRGLGFDSSNAFVGAGSRAAGSSVRCLKD